MDANELNTQLDPTLCNIRALPRQQIAEISRSVVLKKFERRKGERRETKTEKIDENITDKDRRATDRRSTPHLSLLLMAGVLRMSVKYNIRHWLSATDGSTTAGKSAATDSFVPDADAASVSAK